MIKMISTLEVRHSLGQLLNEVSIRNDQIIIERKGKPLAALVPVWILMYYLKNKEDFAALMNKARANAGSISEKDLEEEVLSFVQEIRKSKENL
jgi:hypothetical protein